MKEVLKRGLLVVLAIMLCAMPVVAFSGCNNDDIIEITNVRGITVKNYSTSSDKGYTPHKNTIWYNKTNQRISFYVGVNYENGQYTSFIKYDIPSVHCIIIYNETNTTE